MGIMTIEESIDMEPETQHKLDSIAEKVNDLALAVERIAGKMTTVEDSIKEIKACYVTMIEFRPVQKVVYTMVGCASLAVIVAVVKLVIIKS